MDARAMSTNLTIQTDASLRGDPADTSEDGWDTTIFRVPDAAFLTIDGVETINATRLAATLRTISSLQAKDLGRRLHHAEFVVTSDPEEVKARGQGHDCPSCRQGVKSALAELSERPDTKLAVGTLYWLAEPDD